MKKLLTNDSEKTVWKHAVAKYDKEKKLWLFDILLPKICVGFSSHNAFSGTFVLMPQKGKPNVPVGITKDSKEYAYLFLGYPLNDPNPTRSAILMPKESSWKYDVTVFYSDSLLPPLDDIPLQSDEVIEEFLSEHFENKTLE